MKHIAVCLLIVFFIVGIGPGVFADDQTKSSSDKSLTDTAKEVKTEAVKVYKDSKEAIVRDVNSMKEEVPKGLKEAKESAVQQSKDVMNGATKELKEIRDNIANPKSASKAESK